MVRVVHTPITTSNARRVDAISRGIVLVLGESTVAAPTRVQVAAVVVLQVEMLVVPVVVGALEGAISVQMMRRAKLGTSLIMPARTRSAEPIASQPQQQPVDTAALMLMDTRSVRHQGARSLLTAWVLGVPMAAALTRAVTTRTTGAATTSTVSMLHTMVMAVHTRITTSSAPRVDARSLGTALDIGARTEAAPSGVVTSRTSSAGSML